MTLGFSTIFPKGTGALTGKPTHFIESIYQGFNKHASEQIITYLEWSDYLDLLEEKNLIDLNHLEHHYSDDEGKIHSFRKDQPNRWKVGNKIHFAIGNQTKNYFQFAPIIKVKSIQKVEIKWFDGVPNIFPSDCYRQENRHARIYINDIRFMTQQTIKEIAINDGFDSVADFFEYFNTNWKGKIIHWTNKRY